MSGSGAYQLVTLGQLRLVAPDGSDALVGRRKELALLAYLARRSPRAVTRDELATLLWGDRQEGRAKQSLRHALHQLRQIVGDAIEADAQTIRVVEGRVVVDATVLEREIADGLDAVAVARWGGDFLTGADDVGDEPFRTWLEAEREALRRRVVPAFDRAVAQARDTRDTDAELRLARCWCELFPLDAAARARLVEALIRRGEIDDARAVYEQFTARLASESDVVLPTDLLRLGETLGRMDRQARERRPGSAALLTPDLVGRDAIVTSLVSVWAGTRKAGSAAVIEGEQGTGKSRLVAELRRRARDIHANALVLDARAEASDEAVEWSTLRRVFAPLARARTLENAPNKALGALSAAFPALRERFGALPPATDDPVRLATAAREVLSAVAAATPVLLVVDDLGSADDASRDLFLALIRDVPLATFVVLTTTPGDAATDPLAEEIGRRSHVRWFKLSPLGPEDVSALVVSMLELEPADRAPLAARLHAETGGNPAYLVELISALADAGVLTLNASGRWEVRGDIASRALPVPPSVRTSIKTRLAQLSEPARSILQAIATLDPPAGIEAARHASGLEPAAFEAGIDELTARRLLRDASGDRREWVFAHSIIRRVAAEQVRELLRPIGALAPTGVPEPMPTADARAVPRSTRARWLAVAAAAVVVLAVVAFAASVRGGAKGLTNADPPRVAVLDLTLVTPDTNDLYLAAGLSDEMVSSLARFGRIRTKSARAVRAARARGLAVASPSELGRALDVDYLVEGSLQRVGQSLKVAVRLTDASDGFHVWGHDFEATLGELHDLHQRIATEVAEAIAGRLSPSETSAIRRPLTRDALAFEHYLRGNYLLGRRTPHAVEQAIEQFRIALARDSAFAAAQARIAYGYSLFLDWGWSYQDTSREQLLAAGMSLVQRALARDSTSADAWLSRAYLHAVQDPVSMRGAVEAFARALELDPRNAEAHYQSGQALMALGRWDEARAAYRRTMVLEPDRAQTYVSLASVEWKLGRPEVAIRLYDSALVVEPGAAYARSARALYRLVQGDVPGGREDAEIAVRTTQGYAVPPHAVLAVALARSGDRARANAQIAAATAAMANPAAPSPTDARFIGGALVSVGRADEALDLLERTRPRGAWLWFYCIAPDFDPIRVHPRFVRIMDEARPRPPVRSP